MPATSGLVEELRKKLGWSRQKLAKMAKVSVATISKIEQGLGTSRITELNRIVNVLRRFNSGFKLKEEIPEVRSKSVRRTGKTKISADRRITLKPATEPFVDEPEDEAAVEVNHIFHEIDVKLMNRVLNMTEQDKLNLLEKIYSRLK